MQRFACTASLVAAVAVRSLGAPAQAANWTVARVNHMVLTPPGGVDVAGNERRHLRRPRRPAPIASSPCRKATASWSSSTSRSTPPAPSRPSATSPTIVTNFMQDFEGIAYTNAARNSVFLSDERRTARAFARSISRTGASLSSARRFPRCSRQRARQPRLRVAHPHARTARRCGPPTRRPSPSTGP